MKKLFLLFVLASLACSINVIAAKVDLQPRNVYYVEENDTIYHQMPGLYVGVQNNGPDDFEGLFSIDLYANNGDMTRSIDIESLIAAGTYSTFRVSILKTYEKIVIDSKNVVPETNEQNNNFYFEENKPQVKITAGWNRIIPLDNDTLYVLPNEFFYEQFLLTDLNGQSSIIGIDYSLMAYDFPLTDDNSRFYAKLPLPLQDEEENILGGVYYSKTNNDSGLLENPIEATFQWMANSSASAIDYLWLGSYSGTTKGMPIGSRATIYLNTNSALTNRSNSYDNLTRTIIAIDRIRGDVNDDGIVDEQDLKILNDVVSNGTYFPYISRKNLYTKEGLNYGAGIILFRTPDFVSNCLLNIWIHDQNDPLVQGLGIGELMSETTLRTKSCSIESIPNTYSVYKDELSIYAPEANLYNVTANLKSGKLFQATGKMGEKIIVPTDANNLRVETVKLQGNLATLSPNLSFKSTVSVFPNPFTEYINVKGLDGETVRVVNINGQTIYSTVSNNETELRIDANAWPKGVYLVSLTSKSGNAKNFKIVK